MKIERKEKVCSIVAYSLEIGDCFEYEDGVFMVVDLCNLEAECPECENHWDGDDAFATYNSVITVCFNDSYVYRFTTEMVNPIKLKVVEM